MSNNATTIHIAGPFVQDPATLQGEQRCRRCGFLLYETTMLAEIDAGRTHSVTGHYPEGARVEVANNGQWQSMRLDRVEATCETKS